MEAQPTIGQVIKSIRGKRGFTQKQLAKFIGVTNGTISRIENGHEFPRVYIVEELIHQLDLDAKDKYALERAALRPFSSGTRSKNMNVPQVPMGFFHGRGEEISQIKLWALGKSPDASSLMVVSGTPGIGKSTLIARVLQENEIAKVFAQYIWVKARELSPPALWRHIAEELGVNAQENINLRKQIVHKLHQTACVVVLDGVDGPIDLIEWNNNYDKSRIIITSIQSNLIPPRLGSQVMELVLDKLSDIDSENILVNGISSVNPTDKKFLLETCDGMPLALELANAIGRLDGNFRWLAQQVQVNPVESLEILNPVRKQDSLHLVFDAVCERLSEKDREFFGILSIFIPPFDVETLQRVTDLSIKEIMQALRNLQSLSILRRNGKYYTIHNLLYSYAHNIAQDISAEKIDNIETSFAEHFLRISQKTFRTWNAGDEVSAINFWRKHQDSIALGCQYAAKYNRRDWFVDYLTNNAVFAGVLQRVDLLRTWQRLLDGINLPILERTLPMMNIADGFVQAKRWQEVLNLIEPILQDDEVRNHDLFGLLAMLLAAQAHLGQGNFLMTSRIINESRFLQLSHESTIPPLVSFHCAFITARTHRLLGNYEQFLYWLKKAFFLVQHDDHSLLGPSRGVILFELGQIDFSLNQYEDALEKFQESAGLTEKTRTSNWALSIAMIAWTLALLERLDEAKQWLAKIDQSSTDFGCYTENLILLVNAEIARCAGNYEIANLGYQQVISSSDDLGLTVEVRFIFAKRMLEIGEKDKAEKIIYETMEAAEKNGHVAAFVEAALIYADLIRSHDNQMANQIYEKVIEAAKPVALYDAVADAYHGLGREQEADKYGALSEVGKGIYRLPIQGSFSNRSISTYFWYEDGDDNHEDAAEGF